MPTPRNAHRAATRTLSLCMVVIGVAMIVVTLSRSGGGGIPVGLVLGPIFAAVGVGRIYLSSRT